MKKMAIRLCPVLVLLILGACVSSGNAPSQPKGNDSEAAQRLYQLGVEYYRKGNYDLARDRLLRAIEFDKNLAIAHTALALTYIKLENMRLATEHYETAVRIEPNNVDVRNAYAIFLCGEQRFDEARSQFDRAIRVYENDRKQVMMTNAGVCLSNKPDYELAEQYLRDALEFKPSYGEALLQLAILKFKTGDYLRSRAFLQRYMVSNPTSAEVLFLCVQVEKELGDEGASDDCAQDLLRDYPKSAEAQYVIGQRKSQ